MRTTRSFRVIAALLDSNNGIGHTNQLPWHISEEMKHFQQRTKGSAVIMGRKTWESLPNGPLPGRTNIIVSSNQIQQPGATRVISTRSLTQAIQSAGPLPIFVIGGQRLFEEAMSMGGCEAVEISRIHWEGKQPECDVFFPPIPDHFVPALVSQPVEAEGRSTSGVGKSKVRIEFEVHKPHPEFQYLELIRHVMANGTPRPDRTGVGTLSVFGAQLRFDLQMGFPLLTTKKTFWKGVKEELLWFIRGATNAQELSVKGVRIWDGNGSRDFLDSRGLTDYPEMELGPVYGFQWRHFGGQYGNVEQRPGVDQLVECIRLIREDPTSRRILMSAWNPVDLPKMALPPCHVMSQFYVMDGKLSCHLYQRSADIGLGVPFNIASYALLTHLMAHVTGLQVGDFVHSFGDAHIYTNHVKALQQQLERKPFLFPTLELNTSIMEIDQFTGADIKIKNYQSHPTIKMDMAV